MGETARVSRINSVVNGWKLVGVTRDYQTKQAVYDAVCVNCGKSTTIKYGAVYNQTVKFCDCQCNGRIVPLRKNSKLLNDDPLLGVEVNGWKVIGVDAVAPGTPKRYLMMCQKCGKTKSAGAMSIINRTTKVCHCIYALSPKTKRQGLIYNMFMKDNLDPTEISKLLKVSYSSVTSSINAMMRHYYKDQVKQRKLEEYD